MARERKPEKVTYYLKNGKKTRHFLRKRIDTSELALSDDNSSKMIDLVVENLSLRIQKLLKGLDRAPNLCLCQILHCQIGKLES
jgi:hypothetical protein